MGGSTAAGPLWGLCHSPGGDRDTGAAQGREKGETLIIPHARTPRRPAPTWGNRGTYGTRYSPGESIPSSSSSHHGGTEAPGRARQHSSARRAAAQPIHRDWGRGPPRQLPPHPAPTRDGLLGAEAEGVVHEAALDAAGGGAQGVAHQEGVVAVVDVRGPVELQAAVQHGGVVLVLHDARVDVGALDQRRAVEQPPDAGHGVGVHREGDAPEVLRDGLVQEQDHGGDWGR